MKRFLVFTFDNYYPSGGMNDFKEDFDTLKDAYISSYNRKDNLQIYDTHKMEVVDVDKVISEALEKYE